MREHSVITFRVMFNTDQQEKAESMAEIVEDRILSTTDLMGRKFVLDTEITGHSFHGGRSFLYREPPTGGES